MKKIFSKLKKSLKRPVKLVKHNKNHTLFLKINKSSDYSLKCLQHWIDIAHHMNACYYILCDNEKVKNSILKTINFYDDTAIFLESNRGKFLSQLVLKITHSYWHNATYAHFTPFLYAKDISLPNFWNIDADDTTILVEPELAAKILILAENYAKDNNINAFSFDMHTSRSSGKHWSWGITFVQNNINWFEIFKKNFKENWKDAYIKYDSMMNLDWYMTYLRDIGVLNNKVFYVENLRFIHWGNFLTNPFGTAIWEYSENNIEYFILSKVLNDSDLGFVPIIKTSIQITKLEKEVSLEFLRKFIKVRKEDLSKNIKEFYCGHIAKTRCTSEFQPLGGGGVTLPFSHFRLASEYNEVA